MAVSARVQSRLVLGLVGGALLLPTSMEGQAANTPYHAIEEWDRLPEEMIFGSLSGVFPDPDGRHHWMLSRCGADGCAGSDRDPIFKLDLEGNVGSTTRGTSMRTISHANT